LGEKAVPDTSVLINGALSRLIESGKLSEGELIIPLAVVDELQAQASRGKDVGLRGLEELRRIRALAEERGLAIRFSGERPSLEDIKLARSGRIDALIRDVARSEGGRLYTSDYVQALIAEAEGIPVEYIEPYERVEEFSFKKYLKPNVLSLYLRIGAPPLARILEAGEIRVVRLGDEPCGEEELNRILEELMAAVRVREEADVAMLRPEAMVIETGEFRISLAKPPFSNNLEAVIHRNPLDLIPEESIVDPIVGECLEERRGILALNLEKLYTHPIAERIAEKLQGRGLIARIMGHARRAASTPLYYGPIEGDLEKAVDYVLASGPDYVIFEEIRRQRDFKLIKELRDSGLGVLAFLASGSLRLGVGRVLESIRLTALPELFDEIMLLDGRGVSEVYSLAVSVRRRRELGGEAEPVPIVEVVRSGTGVKAYEVYEVNGLPVVRPAGG